MEGGRKSSRCQTCKECVVSCTLFRPAGRDALAAVRADTGMRLNNCNLGMMHLLRKAGARLGRARVPSGAGSRWMAKLTVVLKPAVRK